MIHIAGFLTWAVLLNVAAWLLGVTLTWQVIVLVVLMEIISGIINIATGES